MTLEALRPAERKSLPKGFKTVIWEDIPVFAQYTKSALLTACKTLNLTAGPVHLGLSPVDAFHQTLNFGGQPADLVLLDCLLDEGQWMSNPEKLYGELEPLAQQSGFDIAPYKLYRRQLFSLDGIHVSILLRLMGYKNDIFFVSSDPPKIHEIISEMERLSTAVPQYQPDTIPVNGYAMKDSCGLKRHAFWANGIILPDYQWNDLNDSSGGLPAAITNLLS